jgi:hypothetical protein
LAQFGQLSAYAAAHKTSVVRCLLMRLGSHAGRLYVYFGDGTTLQMEHETYGFLSWHAQQAPGWPALEKTVNTLPFFYASYGTTDLRHPNNRPTRIRRTR